MPKTTNLSCEAACTVDTLAAFDVCFDEFRLMRIEADGQDAIIQSETGTDRIVVELNQR